MNIARYIANISLSLTSGVMSILFAISDIFSLVIVWSISVLMRYFAQGQFELALYWKLAPSLGLFVLANALAGLYPGILLSPPEELKKIFQSTSAIFLALIVAVFMSKQADLYSRGVFVMAWCGSLLALPLVRSFIRGKASAWDWWGNPAFILGAGRTGDTVAKRLSQECRLGLKVVAFFDDDPAKIDSSVYGIPVVGNLEAVQDKLTDFPDTVGIIAMPGVAPARLVEILEGPASHFRRLIIIPDLFGASSLWISAFDMGGILGLEVNQKLLDPRRQWIKRCMELSVILLCLPLLLFLATGLALAIHYDSPGPIFFRHKRIGLGGKDIVIWKFRTMVADAQKVLDECLACDPELRVEWEENHKLCSDPRITRIGHWLRRTSLDELPQLWNVVKGDLSLVGPRPIVWDEVDKYRNGFELYKKVKPGLSGLWQISGRSTTTYDERVRLDAYYVRNWSIWLDLYILLKTPSEVLRGRGAC